MVRVDRGQKCRGEDCGGAQEREREREAHIVVLANSIESRQTILTNPS